MGRWEAPGKLNLALLVHSPRPDGYHPIESLVQTVEWCDLLDIEDAVEGRDRFSTDAAGIDPEDNLVLRALAAVRRLVDLPPQLISLDKNLPIAAGMGGGSSNAASMLVAAGKRAGLDPELVKGIALPLGADVPLFLTGGTLLIGGIGEMIDPRPPLTGFAMAVVAPGFGLDTGEVYRTWDRLQGPVGETLLDSQVPPQLREGIPLRNDLTPAAIHLEPDLGDFMSEVRAIWGQPVTMTGSGSACFGFFPTVEEATDAASAIDHLCSVTRGVALRSYGVAQVGEDAGQESDHE
jgi:4-diphosphocytidyl-2-C-methyl-D-erythritol kinase